MNNLIVSKLLKWGKARSRLVMMICFAFFLLLTNMLFAQSVTSIKEIRENIDQYHMQNATIEGVITVGANTTIAIRLNAFIQDESGHGLMIFRQGDILAQHAIDMVRGNRLRVTGRINRYVPANGNAVVEIENFTYEVIATNQPVPFIELTIPQANNYTVYEGSFAKVSGVAVNTPSTSGDVNLNIRDGDGNTLIVRVWATTGIDLSQVRQGHDLDVYGVVQQFGTVSQLLPGYQEDILIKYAEPLINNVVTSPPRPFIDQAITVSANIYSFVGDISETTLKYKTNQQGTASFEEVEMTLVSGNTYSATIPAYNTIHTDDSEGSFNVIISATNENATTTNTLNIPVRLRRPEITINNIDPAEPYHDLAIILSLNITPNYGSLSADPTLKFKTIYEPDTAYRDTTLTRVPSTNDYWVILPPYINYQDRDDGAYIVSVYAINELDLSTTYTFEIPVFVRRPEITILTPNYDPVIDSLIVRATINDHVHGIERAELIYTLNYRPTKYYKTLNPISTGSNTYQATLPAFSGGTVVFISVWAINHEGYDRLQETNAAGNEVRYIFPATTFAAKLRIAPKAYNIYEGEKVEIFHFAKAGDKLILRIYDSEGKLVSTPVNTITSGSTTPLVWDGRDSNFRLVTPGLYICHLEVIDIATGNKKTDQAPIVIGTRLR